jgi:hypothetical protein
MARGELYKRRLNAGQQRAFTLQELRGYSLDCGAERLARAQRRQFRCDHPHHNHERLAPIAVALDNFEFAPAQSRVHGLHRSHARREQFRHEVRLGLQKMDIGIP